MNLLPRPNNAPSSNDDNLGRGMEFALVTLVFVLLGLGADAVFGTAPWCTIGFVVFGFAGQFTKMYLTYTHKMTALEAERAAARQGQGRGSSIPEPEAPHGLVIESQQATS